MKPEPLDSKFVRRLDIAKPRVTVELNDFALLVNTVWEYIRL